MPRRIVSYSLVVLAATAVAGGVAANRLLDRPGESALAYLPENALGVACIDLVPAPDQIVAFKSIDDTLKAVNDGKDTSPGAFLASFIEDPVLKPVAEQIDRSMAGAWLPNPTAGGQESGVVIVAIKDPSVVERILKSKGKLQNTMGTAMYRFEAQGDGVAMVHDRYLVVSDQGWALAAVGRVIRGEAKSITTTAAFASARERALPSSNLLVMVNPATVKGDEWLVASMSIRDTGMEMAVSGQTNDPEARKAGRFAPLSPGLLASLPRGAYGFIAAAQPGPAIALAGDSLKEPADSMKEETDLDLQTDVLPALGGNVVLGLYPSFGPDAGLDLLVSIDDANGADPSALAQKLEAVIGKEMAKENESKDWKVTSTSNGTTLNRLADEPTKEMREGLRELEKSALRPLTLSRDKTIAWATTGKGVILATSQSLLERAVVSRTNPSDATSLAGDAGFGTRSAMAADGQFALAFSMKRMVEGIRNTVDPSHMSAAEAKAYRQSLSLYDSTTEPYAIRASMDREGRYKAYMSTPFDWSKYPEFVKSAVEGMKSIKP